MSRMLALKAETSGKATIYIRMCQALWIQLGMYEERNETSRSWRREQIQYRKKWGVIVEHLIARKPA